jgi:hypothetical protein
MQQPKSSRRKHGVRLDAPVVEDVEDWRRTQPEIPSRSEAIHKLVELGLNAARVSGESHVVGERQQSRRANAAANFDTA